MVVLDQFYQIVEGKTHTITVFWKVAHVITFTAAAVCGFLAAFAFGQVLRDFNYNCVLNAHIVFDNNTHFPVHTGNDTRNANAIDLTKTIWGSASECYFVQFTPLCLMIAALIWAVFFIILAKGGAGYPTDLLSKPWNIIYPCLIFCLIALITHIICLVKLQDGVLEFCKQFEPELKNDHCVQQINLYIDEQFMDKHKSVNKIFPDFYINQQVALIGAQLGVGTWVIQLFLLIARVWCVVDFDLHLVTILPKEEELVEHVTEFPDEDAEDETSQV